jgi:hypothetical protein
VAPDDFDAAVDGSEKRLANGASEHRVQFVHTSVPLEAPTLARAFKAHILLS